MKGFNKIFLRAGESKTVSFTITRDLLRFYDYDLNYVAEPGDSLFFNGEIQTIKDSGKETKKVALKPVFLDGANFGYIAVYDSLMFFMNPKLPDRFYNIFNINTGEEIGTFCNKGSGPEEAASDTR